MPEIKHALTFVERLYDLKRVPEPESTTTTLHYGPDPPPGAIPIPATFFNNATYLNDAGIHLDASSLRRIESPATGVSVIPRHDGGRVRASSYDAIGLIFLLISRLEERNAPVHDSYGRYPSHHSVLARHGGFRKPLADIAAHDIASALSSPSPPVPLSAYNVWLTVDVDRLMAYHRPIDAVRKSAGHVLRRGDVHRATRDLWTAFFGGEPEDSFRFIMNQAEHRNLSARFYLMGPSEDREDSPYALRYPRRLRKLADEILQREHVIGFHPGGRSHDDGQRWQKQRQGLEDILELSLDEGRQHQLRFDVSRTWDLWERNNMSVDATLHYPDEPGFRAGTCHAFQAYSLSNRNALNLIERTTHIAEFGLFDAKYLDLNLEDALGASEAIVNVVREERGDLTLLFHTGLKPSTEIQFLSELLDLV